MIDLSYGSLYSLGYIGIFAISLLASLIVFIPVPYLFIILFAALSGKFDPLLLVISSASGATIGKMILYQSFYSGSRIAKPQTRNNLNAFRVFISRYAWIAVMIAAATPSPDDIVYVPLGIARYSRMRFFSALLVGKIIITVLTVYGASILTSSVFGSIFVGGNTSDIFWLISIGIVFAAIAVLITFAIYRIDWEKRLSDHEKRKS